jgi:hypothetical protein
MANVPSVFYVDPDVYLNKQIAANLKSQEIMTRKITSSWGRDSGS